MATTTWAVLKRSFISQGRKELLTPPLTHHLRGHSASLRVEIQVFCLRASLRWLTHLRVVLTPPFLLHKGGVYSVAHLGVGPTKVQLPNLDKIGPPDSWRWYVMSAKHRQNSLFMIHCWRSNLDFIRMKSKVYCISSRCGELHKYTKEI